MTSFLSDGVYDGIQYRVLPDASIEAMMPGGLVKFENMDQLLASADATLTNSNGTPPIAPSDMPDERIANVPASARPLDYYSILQDAIKNTEQQSAQLRQLVYERARFNFKRDILFGHPSLGLADLVRHIDDFELAVARIEANAPDGQPNSSYRDPTELLDSAHSRSNNAVQILPQRPIPPLYEGFGQIQRVEEFKQNRRPEEVMLYARGANLFIGILLLVMVFIGT